ncbi:MAG: carboxypeptidase regulatory-like domain-containing protein [Myxococcales bacterium]|nr:carboxypeptidase regulatory-like domain-containing protein [Myxococcales bacterium]
MSPVQRGGVTFVRARCAQTSSCLLGQVVAAETATPLSRATVFLEREADPQGEAPSEGPEPVEITTLTDDQGVFAIEEPPAGRYRLQVFKRERRLEVRGLALGEPGTTMVPVRLPQG